jgi:hypothetical protein
MQIYSINNRNPNSLRPLSIRSHLDIHRHSSIMSSNMAQDTDNHKPRDTRKVVTPHPRASILNLPANINNLLRSPLASQRPWFRPRLHP